MSEGGGLVGGVWFPCLTPLWMSSVEWREMNELLKERKELVERMLRG